MGAASYKYLLDINGDGDLVDITQYVYRASCWRGRDTSSQLTGRSTAGTCTLYVRNRTSYFSKYNPASPLYGKTLPGMLMKIQLSASGGAYETLWQGDLQSITPDPGDHINGASATLRGSGVLSRISECLVTMPMHQGIKTGAAIAEVLDKANFPAGDRTLDAGQSTLSRWWTQDKITAFQAVRDLEENEAGFVHESKDGKIVFEDRAHRAGHTVAKTWTNKLTGGAIRYSQIAMEDCARDVYNIIEATIHTFNISETQIVWSYVDLAGNNGGDPVQLAPGETKKITAQFTPSGQNIAVNEWGMIDYQAYANSDGSGTELTEHISIAQPDKTGATLDLEITNGSGVTAYVTLLRAHGTMVVESDAATVKAIATAKIDRTYPFPGKYLTNDQEAQDFCDHLLAIYKDPHSIITLSLRAHRDADSLTEAQRIEVSDLIHVEADENVGLFLDEDCFVESVQHDIDAVAGTHLVTIMCSEKSLHDWPSSSYPYTPKVIPPPTTGGEGSPHVPDDLWTNAISSGLRLRIGAIADKWNSDVDQAEFRARLVDTGFSAQSVDLRTAVEGGALTHNGTTQWIVTGLSASKFGAIYQIIAGSQGRLYFAFRLHNAAGWSVWTDGNDTPSAVIDHVDTEGATFADAGPPAAWAVQVIPGIAAGTCRVRASRPSTNGNKILFVFFQVKDSTTGLWRNIDANSGVAGSAAVLYDGSAQAHIYDPVNNTITIGAGGAADFGAAVAANGGLLLMDERCGAFDKDHVIWNGFSAAQVSGNKLLGVGVTPISGTPDGNGLYQDVRIKIITPPWMWMAEGYQGAQVGGGMFMRECWRDGGDTETQTFESVDIPYDSTVPFTHLEGRVWFGNSYSFSDAATYSPIPVDVGQPAEPGTVVLPYAATLTIDCNLGNIFFVELTGNATLQPLVNAKYLRPVILVVKQGSGGNHTLTLDESYVMGTDIPTTPLSTDAGATDLFGLMYDAPSGNTWIVAFVRGYSAT